MDPNTNICNIALGNLGITDQITNVMTEASLEARQCRLHWKAVYLEVLRAYPWRFAVGRWSLGGPSDSDAPAFGWDNAFKLPTDCMRVLAVYGADEAVLDEPGGWEREGDCILTDENGPLYLKGLKVVGAENKLDPLFVTTMGFRLAAAIAAALGESAKLNDMMAGYTNIVSVGKSVDSTEAAPPRRASGGWVSAFRG